MRWTSDDHEAIRRACGRCERSMSLLRRLLNLRAQPSPFSSRWPFDPFGGF